MKRLWSALLATFALTLPCPSLHAAPGDLDFGFGKSGRLTTDFGSVNDQASAMVIQPDNKIVVVGAATGTADLDFAVARYFPDGGPDFSFGTQGRTTTHFGAGNDSARAVVLQSDGKIIVAGPAHDATGLHLGLVRYTANGTLDTTFGNGGKVVAAIGSVDSANAVALQSDGKIIVAGFTSGGSFQDSVLARFNPNGTLDTTFGTTGSTATSLASNNDEITAIVVLGDDSIQAVGHGIDGTFEDFILTRYTANGALDTGFGTNGVVVSDLFSSDDVARALAIQTDGKIVVAGSSSNGSNRGFAVARYSATGTLDATFGSSGRVMYQVGDNADANAIAIQNDGKLVLSGVVDSAGVNELAIARLTSTGLYDTPFGSLGVLRTRFGNNDAANAIAIRNDNRIVVAGYAGTGATFDFALVGIRPDGQPDDTFGTGTGKVLTALGPNDSVANAVVRDTQGRLVVVGRNSNGVDNDFAVARYQQDGGLDGSFGAGGKVFTGFGTGDDVASAVGLQTDGKIVVAGSARPSSSSDFAAARYNTDGTLDTTFATTGKATTSFSSGDDFGRALVVQSDDKIVIAGAAANGPNTSFGLLRYNTNGTLDTSFNTTGTVTTVLGTVSSGANALAQQSDGKLVAAGFSYDGSFFSFALARYTTAGALDSTFGNSGKVTTSIRGIDDKANAVAIQSDGKIVVAGPSLSATDFDFAVVRYLSNGTLDTTFGGTGTIITPIGADDDLATGLVIESSGAVVVAGSSSNGTNYDIAIARYLSGGSLDSIFHTTGKTVVDLGGFDDLAGNLIQQPDGKFVVSAGASNGSTYQFALVRVLGNSPPTVTTLAADNVQNTQADLHGIVNPNGDLTNGRFDYGFDATLSFPTSTPNVNLGGGGSDAPLDQTLTGLFPNSRYYYRAVASNSLGTTFGLIQSFVTPSRAPLVTTQSPMDLTSASATLSSLVNPSGQTTLAHFEYGTDSGLSGATSTTNVNVDDGQGDLPFNQGISGLLPNTQYYYRVVATNATGTSQGTIQTFTTPSGPIITTQAAMNVTAYTSTLKGDVNPNGFACQFEFQYDADPAFGTPISTTRIDVPAGNTLVPQSADITALSAGTTYYFRSVVTTEAGQIFGSVLSFTTGAGALAGPVQNPTNGHIYYLLTADTWTASEARAVALGGHLATVRSAAEDQWIFDTFANFGGQQRSLWIGLNDVALEGTFTWTSGEAVSYTNFDTNQPDNAYSGESYVHITGTTSPLTLGKWNDLSDIGIAPFTGNLYGVVELSSGVALDTTTSVPGEPPGTTFFDFNAPAVDQGLVGGLATTLQGKKKQAVIYGGTDGSVILRTGETDPDGVTFLSLGDPVFAGGGFAFSGVATDATPQMTPPFLSELRLTMADFERATTASAASRLVGLFSRLSSAAKTRPVAVKGGTAPTVGGRFASFPHFTFPRKRPGLLYTALTNLKTFGIYREQATGGDSDLLLREGESLTRKSGPTTKVRKLEVVIPIDTASDQRRTFAPDGGLAAAAAFTDGTNGIIDVAADGSKEVVIDSESPVPGIEGAKFLKLSAPATAGNGVMAFRATLSAAVKGGTPPPSAALFARRNGTVAPVMRVGDVDPARSDRTFRDLGHPLMGQGGLVGLIAALKGQFGLPSPKPKAPQIRKTITQIRNGVPQVMAILEEQAPGCPTGTVFKRFKSMVVTDTPRGQIVFTAIVGGGGAGKRDNLGLWCVTADGEVKLLLRLNQLINVPGGTPTLRLFDALTAKPTNRGQGRSTDDIGFVTAKVTLSDGRKGVLRIPLP